VLVARVAVVTLRRVRRRCRNGVVVLWRCSPTVGQGCLACHHRHLIPVLSLLAILASKDAETGNLAKQVVRHAMQSFSWTAGVTLHVDVLKDGNDHRPARDQRLTRYRSRVGKLHLGSIYHEQHCRTALSSSHSWSESLARLSRAATGNGAHSHH
jgi:hypothetical protein